MGGGNSHYWWQFETSERISRITKTYCSGSLVLFHVDPLSSLRTTDDPLSSLRTTVDPLSSLRTIVDRPSSIRTTVDPLSSLRTTMDPLFQPESTCGLLIKNKAIKSPDDSILFLFYSNQFIFWYLELQKSFIR